MKNNAVRRDYRPPRIVGESDKELSDYTDIIVKETADQDTLATVLRDQIRQSSYQYMFYGHNTACITIESGATGT